MVVNIQTRSYIIYLFRDTYCITDSIINIIDSSLDLIYKPLNLVGPVLYITHLVFVAVVVVEYLLYVIQVHR